MGISRREFESCLDVRDLKFFGPDTDETIIKEVVNGYDRWVRRGVRYEFGPDDVLTPQRYSPEHLRRKHESIADWLDEFTGKYVLGDYETYGDLFHMELWSMFFASIRDLNGWSVEEYNYARSSGWMLEAYLDYFAYMIDRLTAIRPADVVAV